MTKTKSPALGKGLEALLGNIEKNPAVADKLTSEVNVEITYLPVKDIEPNPDQPRKEFDVTALEELAQSIKENGVIVPITVNKRNGKYIIIAGERRYRASKMAGLDKIPAYIRIVTEQQSMQMSLIENIQREDLNAIEIALSLKGLLDATKLSHEELGKKLGKSRSGVANYIRLLNLPAEIQVAIRTDKLSMGHARALLGIEDGKIQIETARKIINNDLSVREVESLVKNLKNPPTAPKKKTAQKLPDTHGAFIKEFSERLDTTVQIKRSQRGKGTITIPFKNDAEFERITRLLTNN